MLRFLGFATLVLIAVCLAVSASIALADDRTAPAAGSLATIEGVQAFDFAVDTDVKSKPQLDEPSAILEI